MWEMSKHGKNEQMARKRAEKCSQNSWEQRGVVRLSERYSSRARQC